jgi:hypothetical protein
MPIVLIVGCVRCNSDESVPHFNTTFCKNYPYSMTREQKNTLTFLHICSESPVKDNLTLKDSVFRDKSK